MEFTELTLENFEEAAEVVKRPFIEKRNKVTI